MLRKELAIIILNWNGTDDSIECLNSLKINKSIYDIYVLDNASEAANVEQLREFLPYSGYEYSIYSKDEFESGSFKFSELNLILSEENFGFAIGNNFVSDVVHKYYKYILLLNNDTIVPEETIISMLKTIKNTKDTALTCDIRYDYDRSILWNAGGNFKWYGDRKYYSQKKIDKLKNKGVEYIKADFITGCALLVDSEFIAQNGLLTNKFFHGEEDYNFCYNLKKCGMTVGVDLSVQLFHKVGKSIGRDADSVKRLRSVIIHYVNRIIDYKSFYGKLRWSIWRRFYLFLIGIKKKLEGMSYRKIKLMKRKIIYYSNYYNNVRRDVFLKIMNDNEIK